MNSTKDFDEWHVHSPNDVTRVSSRGIQLGNHSDKGYDHASGSITASEYEADTLCLVGIGASGAHRIQCWASGGFYVDGSVTANSYNNSSDTK